MPSKKKNKEIKIYVNDKQSEFLTARQRIKTLIAGRGFGKTSVMGFDHAQKVGTLPRARLFFVGLTYKQIITKTLPQIEMMWNQYGYKEHVSMDDPGHYVVGKRPPKEWTKPFHRFRQYENLVSWWNGHTNEFLSMDREDLARGGSFDGGSCDEAALIKREKITKALIPSIRGNRTRFNHHHHGQFCLYTSMPWKTSGQWVLDYEQKAISNPEKYFYLEGTAYDNIDVLGSEAIELMKDEMSYHEFLVEVENERVKVIGEMFYPKFDDEIHMFIPAFNYILTDRGIGVSGSYAVDPNLKIELSFDFGGWFNCLSAYQSKGKTEMMVDAMFVKTPKGIDELVDDFCLKYKSHVYQVVHLYGEPRGNDKTADSQTNFTKVINRFKLNGWIAVNHSHGGRTASHQERRNFMDDVLGESYTHLPKLRINQDACQWVAIAIKLTKTTADGKKDKDLETDRAFPQEQAPHITDTIDYFFYQKYKRNNIMIGAGSVSFG